MNLDPPSETWIPDTLGTDAIITDNFKPRPEVLYLGIRQGTCISLSYEIFHIKMGCWFKESQIASIHWFSNLDALGTDAIITNNLNPRFEILDIRICRGTRISLSYEILHIEVCLTHHHHQTCN